MKILNKFVCFYLKIIIFAVCFLVFSCSKSTPPHDAKLDEMEQGEEPGMEDFNEAEWENELIETGDEDIMVEEISDTMNLEDTNDDAMDINETQEDVSDLPYGSPCLNDRECSSMLCLPEFLGGRCSERCQNERYCSFSHSGTSCTVFGRDSDGDNLTDEVVTACAPRPSGSNPSGRRCVNNEECYSRLCLDGVCSSICSIDSDCVPASKCLSYPFHLDEGEGAYNACGFDTVGAITTQTYDLTTLTLVMESSAGRLQEILVPPDAVSLTITGIQTSPSQAAVIGYYQVFDPENTKIYDIVDFYNGDDPPNWHVPWIKIGIFMVPITPRVSFGRGVYRFEPITSRFVESDPIVPVGVNFSFQLKRAPSASVTTGTVNLNFFFVGLDSVNATNAQVSGSQFQNMLGWLRSIWSPAGLNVGSLTYNDIPEPDASTYRIVHIDYNDPDLGEVGGLLRLSASISGQSANVFFVHDIDESGVLGLSPGIPGPQGIHGTSASGVIVNYDSMWDAHSTAMVVAHELGHYLGLFHSAEQRADPYPGDCIPDTSETDTHNLMYWSWGGDRLTAGQTFVLLRAAVVQ